MVAYTRSIDPSSGELLFDQSSSSWTAGDPDAEALVRVFRTDKGSFVPDPEFGFDHTVFLKKGENAKAEITRECRRATARIVARRRLENVEFDVQIEGQVVAIAMRYMTRSGRIGTLTVI